MADDRGQVCKLSFYFGSWYGLAEEHVDVRTARLTAAHDDRGLGLGASFHCLLQVEILVFVNINRTKETCVVLFDRHNTNPFRPSKMTVPKLLRYWRPFRDRCPLYL